MHQSLGPWFHLSSSNTFCLCSSFLLPIGHSLGPRLFPEAPSPLPPRGPLARGFGPTHFLCRPNSAPTWGGKFLSSRWAVPSSFPAGQESPKRVWRGVGLPGLRPEKGSDWLAVTTAGPGWNSLERSTSPLGEEGFAPGHRQDFSFHSGTPAPPAGGAGICTCPKHRYLPAPETGNQNTGTLRVFIYQCAQEDAPKLKYPAWSLGPPGRGWVQEMGPKALV